MVFLNASNYIHHFCGLPTPMRASKSTSSSWTPASAVISGNSSLSPPPPRFRPQCPSLSSYSLPATFFYRALLVKRSLQSSPRCPPACEFRNLLSVVAHRLQNRSINAACTITGKINSARCVARHVFGPTTARCEMDFWVRNNFAKKLVIILGHHYWADWISGLVVKMLFVVAARKFNHNTPGHSMRGAEFCKFCARMERAG